MVPVDGPRFFQLLILATILHYVKCERIEDIIALRLTKVAKMDVTGYPQALVELAHTERWIAHFSFVFMKHVAGAADYSGQGYSTLSSQLGADKVQLVANCVFDDFVSRYFKTEHGEINIIDEYLVDYGGEMDLDAVKTLRLIRDSSIKPYQVGDVTFGSEMWLDDLTCPGKYFMVPDVELSKKFGWGHGLAARLIRLDADTMRVVRLLSFSRRIGGVGQIKPLLTEELGQIVSLKYTGDNLLDYTDKDLQYLAPHITSFWIIQQLRENERSR